MKYPLLAQAFYANVWCLIPEQYQVYEGILREHMLSGRPSDIAERIGSTVYGQEGVEEPPPQRVALVPLHGTLLNRAGLMEMSGGTSPQALERQIRAVADDPSVSEIVLSIDSPGGQALNIDEAARAVRYAASKKPVTAVANGYMASAAYWIGSQATKIVATPLSYVGSIGAVISHADVSRLLENAGVDMRVYRTGSMKALGQPVDPHEGNLAQKLEQMLSETLGLFAADVALGRKMSSDEVLKRYALDAKGSLAGGTVLGADAVRLGLADEVGSLNDVLADAASRTSRGHRRSNSVQQMKGRNMDPELLEELGLEPNASAEQIRGAILKRENAAKTAATNAHNKALAEAFGIPEGEQADLKTLAAQAADGKAYRADLLDGLHAATIRARGNDSKGIEAADRMKRTFANASIADLRAAVEDMDADLDIPGGRQSKEHGEKPVKAQKGSY